MKRLVLVGAGHAHAQVLLDWARAPMANVGLVVVSPQALVPYSGMVPGWLAGRYTFDEICIDFRALAAAAGAGFVEDELFALDAPRRELRLGSGEVLGYDLLSLNVGSTLAPPQNAGGGDAPVLPLRPLGTLRRAWEQRLAAMAAQRADTPLSVTAVGGGAAGFEALLAVLARLRALRPGHNVDGRLVSRAASLLPGFAPGAVRAAERALARAGVTLQLGTAWSESIAQNSDLVLWATGAEAHAWQCDPQRRGGLAVSGRGFIAVDDHLRSISHPQVHAVGDCAEWQAPLPKAGVYAVRMGPVLSRNLRAALGDGSAVPYAPQRRYLALLATGDGRAIGSWGRWSAHGHWLWRWKDYIDRGFVRRFDLDHPGATRPSLTTGDAA